MDRVSRRLYYAVGDTDRAVSYVGPRFIVSSERLIRGERLGGFKYDALFSQSRRSQAGDLCRYTNARAKPLRPPEWDGGIKSCHVRQDPERLLCPGGGSRAGNVLSTRQPECGYPLVCDKTINMLIVAT